MRCGDDVCLLLPNELMESTHDRSNQRTNAKADASPEAGTPRIIVDKKVKARDGEFLSIYALASPLSECYRKFFDELSDTTAVSRARCRFWERKGMGEGYSSLILQLDVFQDEESSSPTGTGRAFPVIEESEPSGGSSSLSWEQGVELLTVMQSLLSELRQHKSSWGDL